MTNKYELAIDIGKAALENPMLKDAMENASLAAGRLFRDTMPQTVVSAAEKGEKLAEKVISTFSPELFESASHRYIPPRNLMTEIRTAGNAFMRDTDGPSRIVFGENNAVQHILHSTASNAIERADHLLTASYANLLHSDVLAKEAASKVIGQSAGFISQPIERLATVREMQQNAIDGSRAYVTRDAAGANGYTKYLTERFGANTEQHQEWGRNIVTSNGPESGWSATQGPADVNAEIAIIPERGVAAPNPNLVRTPMFAAKKGAAEYLKETGEEPKSSIHPLIQDSFVGRIVPSLGRVDIPDAFVSRPSAATVANVAKIILNDAPRSSLSDGIAAWNAPQTAAQRALHQRIRELYETVSSIPVQPPINAAETTFAAVERNAPLAKQIPDGVQITHFEDGTTEWKVDTTAGITPTQFC